MEREWHIWSKASLYEQGELSYVYFQTETYLCVEVMSHTLNTLAATVLLQQRHDNKIALLRAPLSSQECYASTPTLG